MFSSRKICGPFHELPLEAYWDCLGLSKTAIPVLFQGDISFMRRSHGREAGCLMFAQAKCQKSGRRTFIMPMLRAQFVLLFKG